MTTAKSAALPTVKRANVLLEYAIRALFTALLLTFSWGPTVTIGAFDLRIADLLLVLLVSLFFGKWLLARRLPVSLTKLRQPVLLVLILFAIWTFTSLFVTVTPVLSLRRIVRIWLLLTMVIGVNEMRPAFKWVVSLFSIHILAQSSVALAQAALQRDIGLTWLGEQQMMAQLGYNVLDTGSRLILRVQGLAEHPNLLAITLVVPLLVVLVYVLFPEANMPDAHSTSQNNDGRRERPYSNVQRNPSFLQRQESILPIAALIVGTIALFFTFSRAATLGGMIALVWLLVVWKMGGMRRVKNQKSVPIYGKIVFAGGALLVGLTLFSYRDVVLSRLDFGGSMLEQTSVTERVVQNRVGWKMVQASPLVGVGAHSARERFTEFLGAQTRISHTIHNTVLLISAELGLPAGFLWLILLITPPIYALRHRHALSTPALAYSVALVPYLVTNFTSPASYDTPVGSLLHWLLLALWLDATTQS